MQETIRLLKAIEKHIERKPEVEAVEDYFNAVRSLGEKDMGLSLEYNKRVRNKSGLLLREAKDMNTLERLFSVNKKTYLYAAPVDFDSYCIYLEWDRPVSARFYQPRRQALYKVVSHLQDLEDDKLDILGISLPPGVGKTTLAIFYLTWLAGKYPDKPVLGGSHSNSLLRGIYDECLRIFDPQGEYLWHDVFLESKVAKTNALDMMIDIDSARRFSTLQFTSIGSSNAGKVRAQKLLYCDDLCSGLEEALSKERLDKLWSQYTVDLRQRKIDDPATGKPCKELHIATRWSVHDVIGRLERQYSDNDRVKFLAFPALDKNEKSNFDYKGAPGFSTASYFDIRGTMDDASWRALYMNEPIEREGQLYHPDDLRRYYELPDGVPDAIVSICDPKELGTDYAFLPVAYVYGNDYYIEDCVCDNGVIETIDAKMIDILLRHKVNSCLFESNSAGWRTAEKIQKEVRTRGGITHITTKRTTSNKQTKIIVNSPWVKEHCLFKSKTAYSVGSDYWRMINQLVTYTTAGKNKNDDVPDGMAIFAIYAGGLSGSKIEFGERKYF